MLDNNAVTHVPILLPNKIGTATVSGSAPVEAIATKIPVDADELCITAVINAPAKIPNIVFPSNFIIKVTKAGESASGDIAFFINSIPRKRIPNPNIIFPASFPFLPLENNIVKEPTPKNIGIILSSLNAISCAVTVVPIFAPIITAAAWYRFIRPALTKPTTITVVALLLWIIPVIIAPVATPLIGLDVIFSNIFFSFSPEAFSKPSPIIFIPYRNNPNPPKRPIIIFIAYMKSLHT